MKHVLLPVLVLCACTPSPELKPEDIIGTWVTKEIRIQIMSKDGGPDNDTLHVLEKDFPEFLGIDQNIGIFGPDGSYTEKFTSSSDGMNFTGKGSWSIKGDSLLVVVDEPNPNRTMFGVVLKGDRIEVTAYVDWDRDGAADDRMLGISELVK